jgi:hypothetical protein
MTWSIISSFAKRFLAMTRCAGRSTFFSRPFGFVCLAISLSKRRIFSPREHRRTKEMARATNFPDRKISRESRRTSSLDMCRCASNRLNAETKATAVVLYAPPRAAAFDGDLSRGRGWRGPCPIADHHRPDAPTRRARSPESGST